MAQAAKTYTTVNTSTNELEVDLMKSSIKTFFLMLIAFVVGIASKTVYIDIRIANGSLAYEVATIHSSTVTVWYNPKEAKDDEI